MTPSNRSYIVAQVLDLANDSFTSCCDGHPAQGQMVTTGFQFTKSAEKLMGFCVQVRKGRGQFGSDLVFLRHPDGGLTTHENQSFFGMTPAQEELARPLFKSLPEDEDYSRGYKCCDKVLEVGFVVENSQSQPIADGCFGVAIRSASHSIVGASSNA